MSKKVPTKVREIQEWKAEKEADAKSISFSQLSVYLNCPKCWQRSYILNEAPFIPSIHLIFGTAIHECLQSWLDILYNKTIKESEELNLPEMLLGKMKSIYAEERSKYGKDFSTPQELANFYQDGIAILEYVKKHRKEYFSPGSDWLVGCEVPILFKLRDRFYFKGFIDILTYNEPEDRWKIWDIKTSGFGWRSEKADKHKTNQVLLYKYFLAQQFGLDINKIDVEYFIVKRKIPNDPEFPAMAKRVQEFVPANGTPSVNGAVRDVTNFCGNVLLESGDYQQKEYQATPSGKACKWCLFKDSCKFMLS